MSYQDTLARIARLKGVEPLDTVPAKTAESPFGSLDSAPPGAFGR